MDPLAPQSPALDSAFDSEVPDRRFHRLCVWQPEIEGQPGTKILKLYGLSSRDQKCPHVRAESFAGEYNDAMDRPRADVLNRRRDLFFSSSLRALELAFHSKRLPCLRLRKDDVDLSDRSPDTASNTDLLACLET